MKFLNRFSLKTRLIAMVVFVVASLTTGSYLVKVRLSSDFEKSIEYTFRSAAHTLSDKIQAQFYERYGDVQAFALNETLQSLDGKVMQEDLNGYATLYGIYDLILVVDTKGRFVGSNQKSVAGKPVNQKALSELNFSEAPWFKASMEGKFTEDAKTNFVGTFVEDPHIDPLLEVALGEKLPTTGFSSTIKNLKGEVIGVVTNRTNSKWLDTEVVQTFQILEKMGAHESMVTITNKEGKIILDYRPFAIGKKELIYDLEKMFLKSSISDLHEQVAPHVLAGEAGVMKSVDKSDGAMDVVGFETMEGPKWISSLGWKVVVHDSAEELMAPVNDAKKEYFFLTAIATALAFGVAIIFSLSLSKTISKMTELLSKNSHSVSDAASKIASSSTQLSESATEQAAALQETVAAVDEISAMVDKNAEAANRSKEASAQSRDAAMRGRQIVDDMIQAIGEINQSNDEVSNQMEQSNSQLVEITRLINDIGSKTKVINEIVFQTKLLSFNASVEAARAGEYGKGFAVVAEEVGNLAQMSGNAAKEITTLLEESVHKVENIVSESKAKIERLMNNSREKVKAGSDTATTCNQALEEILGQVSSVDTLVSEIAVASQEQASGIREIAKAVGQMESVTQQNSSVAESTSIAGEQLNGQSTQLKEIVEELVVLVKGAGAQFQSEDSSPVEQEPETKKSASVLKFKKPERAVKPEAPQAHHEVKLKKAAGSDIVPSSDHSGFEE